MRITRRAGLKGLTASAAAVAMPGIVRSEEPEIVIGAPNSLTGGIGEGGQRSVWALQIAIDQINREGGIKAFEDYAGQARQVQRITGATAEQASLAAAQFRHFGIDVQSTPLAGGVNKVRVVGQPVSLSRTPSRVAAPPPRVGEHTDEVLGEFGFAPGEIEALRAAKAI